MRFGSTNSLLSSVANRIDDLSDTISIIQFVDFSNKFLIDQERRSMENNTLTQMSGTISHEMRNPLNAIINNAEAVYAYME